MPSRHQVEKRLPHEIDIKGIAVALAFLVSIGVFAIGRDDGGVSEDRQSSSVSMQVAPIVTAEQTETLQQSDDDEDFSDTSLNDASAHRSVTP